MSGPDSVTSIRLIITCYVCQTSHHIHLQCFLAHNWHSLAHSLWMASETGVCRSDVSLWLVPAVDHCLEYAPQVICETQSQQTSWPTLMSVFRPDIAASKCQTPVKCLRMSLNASECLWRGKGSAVWTHSALHVQRHNRSGLSTNCDNAFWHSQALHSSGRHSLT